MQFARRRGAILMEIVLALAIFAGAAAIVHLGLSRSLVSARRLRLQAQAENLALSKLAEIQAGITEAATSGPNSYEEEDPALVGWEWSVEAESVGDNVDVPPLLCVTVTVSNPEQGISHRMAELMPDQGGEE